MHHITLKSRLDEKPGNRLCSSSIAIDLWMNQAEKPCSSRFNQQEGNPDKLRPAKSGKTLNKIRIKNTKRRGLMKYITQLTSNNLRTMMMTMMTMTRRIRAAATIIPVTKPVVSPVTASGSTPGSVYDRVRSQVTSGVMFIQKHG